MNFFKKNPNPVELPNYRKTIKVYDTFIFFNELELLEMRLNILAPHVDHFVIIEATQTFSGLPKPLIFQENKDRFKKFLPKIIHYVVDDMPASAKELKSRLRSEKISQIDREIIETALTSDNVPEGLTHWLKEFYQKECIKKALTGLNDADICFISDVDEIWNPETLVDYRSNKVFKMRQDVYTYYLNNRSSEPWAGSIATKYKNIRNASINHLDTPSKTRYAYVKNGGWHFTNQGGADRIKTKLESYGHQEFNNAEIKGSIEENMKGNKDFIGRRFRFWTSEKELPAYLIANRSRYEKLFK